MGNPNEHTSAEKNDKKGKEHEEHQDMKDVSDDLRKEIQELKKKVDKKDPLWLKVILGLGTPLTIAFIGVLGSATMDKMKSKDMDNRLYLELMSKQAEGENTERLKMFSSILESVLKSRDVKNGVTGSDEKSAGKNGGQYRFEKKISDAEINRIKDAVIQLELLARNFNETIDMKPVFTSLNDDISEMICRFGDTSKTVEVNNPMTINPEKRRLFENPEKMKKDTTFVVNSGQRQINTSRYIDDFKWKYRRKFWRRRKKIDKEQAEELVGCLKDLNGIAKWIRQKQAEVLRGVGEEMRVVVPVKVQGDECGFKAGPESDVQNEIPEACVCTLKLKDEKYSRKFRLEINDISREFNTVSVAVASTYLLPGKLPDSLTYNLYRRAGDTSGDFDGGNESVVDSYKGNGTGSGEYQRCKIRRDYIYRKFTLRNFDFPKVDNIYLSEEERCALVLNSIDSVNVDISLLYFPARYAAIKDRSFYQARTMSKLNLN